MNRPRLGVPLLLALPAFALIAAALTCELLGGRSAMHALTGDIATEGQIALAGLTLLTRLAAIACAPPLLLAALLTTAWTPVAPRSSRRIRLSG